MPDANTLLTERANLLARLIVINANLADLGAPAQPVHVRTHSSIRWSGNYEFFNDATLTVRARIQDHEAWVSRATLAAMREKGDLDPNRGNVQVLPH